MYRIEFSLPGAHLPRSVRADNEREARRIAARLLGRKNLRGASTWTRNDGGVAYQFGGHSWVRNERPEHVIHVVIVDEDIESWMTSSAAAP